MRVLSFDPAKNTFGYAVTDVTKKRVELLEFGMLEHSIKDLTGLVQRDVKMFTKWTRTMCTKYNVDILIAERFMNRGRFGGNSGEVIGIIIGASAATAPVKDVRLLTSAQWKNSFNRIDNLDELYESAGVTHHEVDATLIGVYGSADYLGITPYSNLQVSKLLREIRNE